LRYDRYRPGRVSDIEEANEREERPFPSVRPALRRHNILNPHYQTSNGQNACRDEFSNGAPFPHHKRECSGSSGPGDYQTSTQVEPNARLQEIESSEDEGECETKPVLSIRTSETAVDPNIPNLIPRMFKKEENSYVQPAPSSNNATSFEGPNARLGTPLAAIIETDHLPLPQIDVEDNEEGYIFDRPNRTRVRAESDDEDKGENPAKRRRTQGPDELSSSHPNHSSTQIHIKHSGGRRTFGLSRGR
jgi:hypothetical protein